jgi:hypothetical protein
MCLVDLIWSDDRVLLPLMGRWEARCAQRNRGGVDEDVGRRVALRLAMQGEACSCLDRPGVTDGSVAGPSS